MRYLIVMTGASPFYTEWFSADNNFVQGMTVFDLVKHLYTENGYDWIEIEQDHL